MFVYGQTSTGKTYTIEGDLDTSSSSNINNVISKHVGMILRSLYYLFQELKADSDSIDFSVKASYIELFNEELKDLLFDPDSTDLKKLKNKLKSIYLIYIFVKSK